MNGDNTGESKGSDVGRRSFLKAAGVATAAAGLVSGNAAAEQTAGDLTDNLLFVGAGDTIQEAHDSLGGHWTDAGRIVITQEYDPAVEDYPIEWSKRASLHGGNYTNLRPDSGEYAIVVDIENAKNNRPPGPHFNNFSITGGGGGIHVENGRYTIFRDIDVNNVSEHGFSTDDYNPWDDDPDTDDTAINTHHWYSCTAERCGGHGFYIGQRAHGSQLHSCQAYFNGKDGIHIAEGTVNAAMFGGSSEQNARNGIRVYGAFGFGAKNVYLEANNPNQGGGSEVLVTKGAKNTTFDTCYGNGFNDTQRMFYLYSAEGTDIRNCHYQQYSRSFLYVRDLCRDTDIHRGSHFTYDDTPFGGDDGVRTRSDGIIVAQDLRNVEGNFNGDRGIHVRDNGKTAICTWYDGEWYTHGVSEAL